MSKRRNHTVRVYIHTTFAAPTPAPGCMCICLRSVAVPVAFAADGRDSGAGADIEAVAEFEFEFGFELEPGAEVPGVGFAMPSASCSGMRHSGHVELLAVTSPGRDRTNSIRQWRWNRCPHPGSATTSLVDDGPVCSKHTPHCRLDPSLKHMCGRTALLAVGKHIAHFSESVERRQRPRRRRWGETRVITGEGKGWRLALALALRSAGPSPPPLAAAHDYQRLRLRPAPAPIQKRCAEPRRGAGGGGGGGPARSERSSAWFSPGWFVADRESGGERWTDATDRQYSAVIALSAQHSALSALKSGAARDRPAPPPRAGAGRPTDWLPAPGAGPATPRFGRPTSDAL